MKFYDELKWRGLIKDEAGEDLEEKLKFLKKLHCRCPKQCNFSRF